MASILDQFGKPIERQVLDEPQTARLGWLALQYENHPSRGLTPPRLARILEVAERGNLIAQSDLFLDMEEKDAHIFAEMSKRKRGILTLPWDIVPPRNASKQEEDDAAWLKEVLLDMEWLDDALLDALDAVGHGFAALEMEWQLLGKEMLIKSLTHRPQSWFQTAICDRNQIRLRDNTANGAELWPFGWVLHTHKAKSGYIARAGLHRVLAWPFLFKNYSVRDLAEFLEIYGLPLRLGKYPTGSSDDEKATLLRAVTGIGHNAAGIIPEGMAIEFEEAAKGTHDPFKAMIEWAEKSESKAILGGTLTTQADGKSSTHALGNVHNEVRHDLLTSDAKQLGATITRDILYPLIAINRGARDYRRMPRMVFDTGEAEDLSLYADALPKLVGVGMKIPETWAHDKLRIPQPDDGEAVLATAQPQQPPSPGQTAATAALTAANSEPDELDLLADDLAGDWEKVTDPILIPIVSLAKECKDFAEFNKRLPEVIGQMDPAALTEMLAQGQFMAHVWGRVNGPNNA